MTDHSNNKKALNAPFYIVIEVFVIYLNIHIKKP